MPGTIRLRRWRTRRGELRVAFVADYYKGPGQRWSHQFETRDEAEDWLTKTVGHGAPPGQIRSALLDERFGDFWAC